MARPRQDPGDGTAHARQRAVSVAAGWNRRPPVVESIPADQRIWFVSDLHIGDATPSDVFFGKDRYLVALLERIEREGGMLVVCGDAIDFHQAWSLTRVIRPHQELFGALSRLARQNKLVYVIGNHDYEINLYNEILQFRVCDELHVGDHILVVHGWQFDPYLKNAVHIGYDWSTTFHHLVERWLGTWLRIPLGEFYTLSNRLMFWLVHKVALVANVGATVLSRVGLPRSAAHLNTYLTYWARSNMGDPMGIYPEALETLTSGPWKAVVCGHSHLPGVVSVPGGRTYVNTGSWTFASSHYALWDGTSFTCRDWITGTSYGPELYQPLIDGVIYEKDYWQWWRENYMGFLRFREGEERRGRLRGWESYVRDTQHLSQLQPVTLEPLPREITDDLPDLPEAS
jgi:UDP-2,3-diacylglucosamine pyrophosphatase LpxH